MRYLFRHKILTGILILIVVVGGYGVYKKRYGNTEATRYVLGTVTKGTLVTSVSGSGQVSVSNQVDIKPKVSGDVAFVGVANGQEVRAGTLLIQLDSRDAQKAVRDAEANVASAKLTLDKLKKPVDQLALLQAENAIVDAKEAKKRAEDDLRKAYEDGFNTVSNAFLDLPTIVSSVNDILFGSTINSSNQWNIDYYTSTVETYDSKVLQYRNDASKAYQTARTSYDANFNHYKNASRFSADEVIAALIDETYDTVKNVAESVKNSNNLIQFYKDKLIEKNFKPHALADTHLTSLTTFTGKTNTHLLNLFAIRRTMQTSKETIASADRAIVERAEYLAKLKAGTDALDLASQELSIQQRQNALIDAREKLPDYFVRAPFDGVVAKVNPKKGDAIGPSTVAVTLITKRRTAELSFNEVDVAKIRVDEKATLTFDALPELTLSGVVSEIDTVGTMSQGVVSYTVKIIFDTQDDRVKPGMSVTAAIITEAKQNILVVLSGAVKTQGSEHVVAVFDAPPRERGGNQGIVSVISPRQQSVEIGMSNDTMTEIISGLQEGDTIVVRTITPTATTTQQAPTIFGNAQGGRGGGGGVLRIPR